ncbi:MAG: hypothetical protein J2O49_08590 [Sciscionella sp.]|nr:hypothetical protein [Sciscionella sp.]
MARMFVTFFALVFVYSVIYAIGYTINEVSQVFGWGEQVTVHVTDTEIHYSHKRTTDTEYLVGIGYYTDDNGAQHPAEIDDDTNVGDTFTAPLPPIRFLNPFSSRTLIDRHTSSSIIMVFLLFIADFFAILFAFCFVGMAIVAWQPDKKGKATQGILNRPNVAPPQGILAQPTASQPQEIVTRPPQPHGWLTRWIAKHAQSAASRPGSAWPAPPTQAAQTQVQQQNPNPPSYLQSAYHPSPYETRRDDRIGP